MPAIHIPNSEYGVVRIFALSLSDEGAAALSDAKALEAALGADVDQKGVEIIRVADLGDLGLIGYLRDGVDLKDQALHRDGVKLAALQGWVMVLYSTAFEGAETTLTPAPELTLIGTYSREKPAPTDDILISDAAVPYSGHARINPPVAPRGAAGGSLVVVGLAVLALLILWWAFW
ncbi:MAG: hypothetical protein ACJAVM_001671 [Sulfitobacter sp.]|jgi:hypothetical protein